MWSKQPLSRAASMGQATIGLPQKRPDVLSRNALAASASRDDCYLHRSLTLSPQQEQFGIESVNRLVAEGMHIPFNQLIPVEHGKVVVTQ